MATRNQKDQVAAKLTPRAIADRGTASRGIAPTTSLQIEFWPVEKEFVFKLASGIQRRVRWAEDNGFLPIPTRDQLPPGTYRCLLGPRGTLEIPGQEPPFTFPGWESFPEELRRAFEQSLQGLLCTVNWHQRSDPDDGSAKETSTPKSAPAASQFRVQADSDILRSNAWLRTFVSELLSHFANAPGRGEMSYDDIQSQITKDHTAREIVVRTTQAWQEFERAGSGDLAVFERLAETLVEQWTFGNATVQNNQLVIRRLPEGWGLYHRGSGIRYYNEFGVPVESFVGTTWEKHYKWADKSKGSSPIQLDISPDDPIFALIEAYRAAGVPHPDQVEAAAKGYYRNAELLLGEIKRNPGKWENVQRALQEQTGSLAVFLGLEGLAAFLEIQPHWAFKLVGHALRLSLKGFAYSSNIRYAGNATQMLLAIGASLYRIKRQEDGILDPLSQRHLANAAESARLLVEEVAQLVAVMAAKKTAEVISRSISPGGPAAPQLAPAAARGSEVGMRTSSGGTEAVAITGGPRIPPGIVLMGTGNSDRGKRGEGEGPDRKGSDHDKREALEHARRMGEREWQRVERELKNYLSTEPLGSNEIRYAGQQARTVFEAFAKELEARVKSAGGDYARVHEVRDRMNKLFNGTRTVARLLEEMGLSKDSTSGAGSRSGPNTTGEGELGAYEKYQAWVTEQTGRAQERLRLARMNRETNPAEVELAQDEVKYLAALSARLEEFRRGDLSLKVFDGVQVFLERDHVAVTDATLRVKEIFHQIKSMVYREMWKKIFPGAEVEVWEFRSATAVYKVPSTQDFAQQIERSIDLQRAQEGMK